MPTASRDRVFRVLHLEDSELDHELLLAHLARGGIIAHTRRVESELDVPRGARASPGTSSSPTTTCRASRGLVALELLKAHAPRRALHPRLRRDRRGHRGRGDAPRRQPTTCRRTTWRGWCRRCCTRSTRPRRGAPRVKRRPRPGRLEAAPARARAAPADQRRARARRDRARDPRRRRRLADGAEVRPRLDRPPLEPRRR